MTEDTVGVEFASNQSSARTCALDIRGPKNGEFFDEARRVLLGLGVRVVKESTEAGDNSAYSRVLIVDVNAGPLTTQQRERVRLALIGLALVFTAIR